MAERPSEDEQHQAPTTSEDMTAFVNALDAALLPCLTNIEQLKAPIPDFQPPLADFDESMTELEAPTMELQPHDDRPPHHQTDVEKQAKEFMEASKRLQQYFISLQCDQNKPTKAETLRKEIASMEEESKIKDELIQKHEKLIQDWKTELKDRLDKHKAELEMV